MSNQLNDAGTAQVSTPAPTTSSSTPSGGAQVQLKASLRGQDFAAQSASLSPRENARSEPVQAKGDPTGDVHAAAARGTSGGGGAMPHLGAIQHSFGHHEVGAVQAHVGGAAKEASQAMGAEAYASGNHVAFAETPDLHTAAHEAAHVVQQKAGVSLSGGVGQAGDAYEQHADAVADQVVQGKSAQSLLDSMGGGGGASVQRKVQRSGTPLTDTELPGLGFSTIQVSDLVSTFGDDGKLKDFVDAAGGTAKLKELFITRGVPAAQLLARGGAFFKDFVGCGDATISHVTAQDGIEAGAIKGCHDEDAFRAEVLTMLDYNVQDKDIATKAPLFEPIPQSAKDKFAEAQKKYQGQMGFFNGPKNTDGKGGKKLTVAPQAPVAPTEEPKMVTLNLERGRINSETPLTVPGVKNLEYELRKMNDAEWRNSSNTKTTIKGLASNSVHWQTICNEAIWASIKAGTFGTNWSGVARGATITGYYNGGPQVDTFFFTT